MQIFIRLFSTFNALVIIGGVLLWLAAPEALQQAAAWSTQLPPALRLTTVVCVVGVQAVAWALHWRLTRTPSPVPAPVGALLALPPQAGTVPAPFLNDDLPAVIVPPGFDAANVRPSVVIIPDDEMGLDRFIRERENVLPAPSRLPPPIMTDSPGSSAR